MQRCWRPLQVAWAGGEPGQTARKGASAKADKMSASAARPKCLSSGRTTQARNSPVNEVPSSEATLPPPLHTEGMLRPRAPVQTHGVDVHLGARPVNCRAAAFLCRKLASGRVLSRLATQKQPREVGLHSKATGPLRGSFFWYNSLIVEGRSVSGDTSTAMSEQRRQCRLASPCEADPSSAWLALGNITKRRRPQRLGSPLHSWRRRP
jgi:hypothetical protein